MRTTFIKNGQVYFRCTECGAESQVLKYEIDHKRNFEIINMDKTLESIEAFKVKHSLCKASEVQLTFTPEEMKTKEEILKAAKDQVCEYHFGQHFKWDELEDHVKAKLLDEVASHLSERVKELEEKVKKQDQEYVSNGSIQEWKDYAERTTKIINDLKARIKELESQQQPVREVLKKAEVMYTALNKLLTGLAKDGTAIDGFTDGWKATQEYTSALLEYQISLFPPNQNVKE